MSEDIEEGERILTEFLGKTSCNNDEVIRHVLYAFMFLAFST